MLKICGRPLVAVATYDADQEKPVEPMTIIEQREYKLPRCTRLHNGKMALVVRKHSSGGGSNGGAQKDEAKGGVEKKEIKKGSNGRNGNGNGNGKKEDGGKKDGGEKKDEKGDGKRDGASNEKKTEGCDGGEAKVW